MKTLREVVQDWVEAYNARDPYALIDLYHDDAVNHQVAFGAPLEGREALLQSFVEFFAAIPNSYTNPVNILVDGEWAVVEWSGGGTLLGQLGNNPATGKSFQLQGCGFFHIVEGRIKFQRGYIDKHTWFSQVGIPIT